jgi:hypothetical protein
LAHALGSVAGSLGVGEKLSYLFTGRIADDVQLHRDLLEVLGRVIDAIFVARTAPPA